MLSQYDHNTALYFGHRYAEVHVGEGYFLSKSALIKFEEELVKNKTICSEGSAKDL